jgi:hypothetical protein
MMHKINFNSYASWKVGNNKYFSGRKLSDIKILMGGLDNGEKLA